MKLVYCKKTLKILRSVSDPWSIGHDEHLAFRFHIRTHRSGLSKGFNNQRTTNQFSQLIFIAFSLVFHQSQYGRIWILRALRASRDQLVDRSMLIWRRSASEGDSMGFLAQWRSTMIPLSIRYVRCKHHSKMVRCFYVLVSDQGEIALFYSAKGNGEWTGTPINLAPAPLCDKYNQEYRKFVMKPLASASDMPDADSGDLCEIFEQVRCVCSRCSGSRFDNLLSWIGYRKPTQSPDMRSKGNPFPGFCRLVITRSSFRFAKPQPQTMWLAMYILSLDWRENRSNKTSFTRSYDLYSH